MKTTHADKMGSLRTKLEQRGMAAIRSGTEWLSVDELMARFPTTLPSAAILREFVERRSVFSIELDGREVFALYEFSDRGEPLPEIGTILEIFRGRSVFRIAGWFESTTGALEGHRPRELIQLDPAAVIQAALDHVVGPRHG